MKAYIVLISVDHKILDARKACEQIENTLIKIEKSIHDNLDDINVANEVFKLLKVEPYYGVEVANLSDFMDTINDEEFNPDYWFMSYVYVEYL